MTFALFLTFKEEERVTSKIFLFAALIDFDALSQNQWKQMAEERTERWGLSIQSPLKKTTWRPGSERKGNLWASQEAATFLRLGLEKRRPLRLMPQTKEWNNL